MSEPPVVTATVDVGLRNKVMGKNKIGTKTVLTRESSMIEDSMGFEDFMMTGERRIMEFYRKYDILRWDQKI